MVAVNMALIVSAVSPLDSTLASASRLVVVDMRTVTSGRIAGSLRRRRGVGNGVDVSRPPSSSSLSGARRAISRSGAIPSFVAAISGAVLCFLINGKKQVGHDASGLMDVEHKYTALLYICIVVPAVGCGAFAIGARTVARPRMA